MSCVKGFSSVFPVTDALTVEIALSAALQIEEHESIISPAIFVSSFMSVWRLASSDTHKASLVNYRSTLNDHKSSSFHLRQKSTFRAFAWGSNDMKIIVAMLVVASAEQSLALWTSFMGRQNHQSVSSHKNCLINQKSCVKFELCLPNCFWTASEKNSLLRCLRPVMDCELKCLRLQEGSFIKRIRRQHVSSSRACNFMQIQSNLLLLILMVQQLPANVQSLLRVFNVICLHIRPLAINLLMQQVL